MLSCMPRPLSNAGASEEAVVRHGHIQRQQGAVVVGTLLDKAPNLGGLARTCEIFGAAALVVPDRAVLQDASFLSVSVSAELWVSFHHAVMVLRHTASNAHPTPLAWVPY